MANIRFNENDWQHIVHDWNAWWAGELDRPLIVLETSDPISGVDQAQLTKFGLDTPIDQILNNWERILEATHWHGDAFPKWWVNFGPGVMAAFLGSQPTWSPDTTWFWPLSQYESLADIPLTYDFGNPWWQHILNITEAAVTRWGDQVLVGHTDLGGNLDILASLRGSDKLLLDLADTPDLVKSMVYQITKLWISYYDDLYEITSSVGRGNACWGPCWSPGKGYMLQSDFSYMISPRMFKQFVMPDLTACCDHLDYAFYHLDGIGEIPHVDQLMSIERLHGIQWQPGDGQPMAEGWLEFIGRIRDGGKLCQIYVTRDGARTVQRELGGKGFLMHISGEAMTPDEAEEFISEMQG